jgi:probable phosphoglycerate mutase
LGIKQAEALGDRLSKKKVDRIYCSDLKRTMQTAEIVNKYVKSSIIVREELREIHMGRFHTQDTEAIKAENPYFWDVWSGHLYDIPYPEGESGHDVRLRVLKVIKEIISQDFDRVLLVTHGGVIRVMVSHFLGLSMEKRFKIGMPPEPCGMTIVRYEKEEREFYVHTVNDAAHIEGLI